MKRKHQKVIVTKLTYGKKNPNRVNLFVDDKFEASVLVDSVVSMSLKSGDEITEIDLRALKSEVGWQKWIDKSLNFIAIRPRSRKEIEDYLKTKLLKYKTLKIETGLEFTKSDGEDQNEETKSLGVNDNQDLINSLITFLDERGYINDEEFAVWFTRQRLTGGNPKGLTYIKSELFSRGINKNDIEIAFDKLKEETEDFVQDALTKAFAKQVRKYKDDLSEKKVKGKVINYLISKGFDFKEIKLKVDEFTHQI